MPLADDLRPFAQWLPALSDGQVAQLEAMPQHSVFATVECAGNGRGQMSPRYPSMPWLEEGVSTAEWTGVPLRVLLEAAGLEPARIGSVFSGICRWRRRRCGRRRAGRVVVYIAGGNFHARHGRAGGIHHLATDLAAIAG